MLVSLAFQGLFDFFNCQSRDFLNYVNTVLKKISNFNKKGSMKNSVGKVGCK